MVSHCDFDLYFLMINDEYFSCANWPFVFFHLERYLFKSFAHFKIELLVFLLKCEISSYILIQVSYQQYDFIYLYLSMGFLFTLLMVSFEVQLGDFNEFLLILFFLLPLVQTSSLVSYLRNNCLI